MRKLINIVLSSLLGLALAAPSASALGLGSLVVNMTSPSQGSTVSGTVPVSASVSVVGLLLVRNVQFELDGANLGAADGSAPYSIAWNTAGASNGAHSLRAVATDSLGIRWTSNTVSVTVSNAPPPPPPDTTPPNVSVSSPASGSSVSGTINVTANASDNVGVVGVQFQLDGANAGAEDTTAPYSVPWNTTTASNGTHTITAVARDAAGNRTTSSPVTVTVSNNAPPPPPPAGKRYEETDPAVSFTSGWTLDTSRAWSAGGAAVTSTAGERATITFTGTSVSWIGGRSPGTGIARILVDGTQVAQVDTYSKTEEIRVPMVTVNGLSNASHTLTIEVTGSKNAAASGALIVVDAFDVPGPAVSRLQETDPDIAYTAGWTQGDTSRSWSQGIAATSATTGAQATLSFTGTSITWIGARAPVTGIARVYLDGTAVADVDTYAPAEQIQQAVFSATGLADTAHTVTIEVTGTKNASSSSALIVVDGFEVGSPGAQVQETDPAIAYSGAWAPDNRDKAYNQGAAAESDTTGATATFTFSGTGVSWIGARGPQTGTARISIDGAFVQDIDTYAPTEGPQHTDFSVTGLPAGTHTLTIEVTGRNPASTDAWILVDAFNVVP